MRRTVRRRLDRLWKLGDGHLETRLDRLEHLLVALVRDERDGETLGTKATGTSDTVKVRVGFARRVIIDLYTPT